jgi:hypothetical protein
MKAKILLIWLFAGLDATALAQSTRITAPRLAVKWSVPHLFYFYPSLQFALEHKLVNNLNIQYDLGWVFERPYLIQENSDYENKNGFRGIAELRYYIPSPPKIPFYLAGEFYYSNITFNRSRVVGYGCASGDCNYFESVATKVRNDHHGAGLKYGILLYPGWNKNGTFFFDLNIGVAYRKISYTDIGTPLPANAEILDDRDDGYFFGPDETDRYEFRPVLGCRLSYAFLK